MVKILEGVEDLLYWLADVAIQVPKMLLFVFLHPVKYADRRRTQSAELYIPPGVLFAVITGLGLLSEPLEEQARRILPSADATMGFVRATDSLLGDWSKLSLESRLLLHLMQNGGLVLGSAFVLQHWLPPVERRSHLSRELFSLQCAHWSVALFVAWFAKSIHLLGVIMGGPIEPRASYRAYLVVAYAGSVWFGIAWYGLLRRRAVVSRLGAVGVVLLSFLGAYAFCLVAGFTVAPGAVAELFSTSMR